MLVKHLLDAVVNIQAHCFRGPNVEIVRFSTIEEATSDDIVFLNHAKYLSAARVTRAGAIVMSEQMWAECRTSITCPAVIFCENPYAFFAFASQCLEQARVPKTTANIDPTARIHASVKISEGVTVGPYSVIDAGATLGENVTINAHCTVGKNTHIGMGTLLYANVVLYDDVILGKSCIIHSGTVIGSDGFGFAQHKKKWIKIPQTGTVRIGNDVEIGANCAIDRGALGDTLIGSGTKLDNLIQVAHNVVIGKDCAIAAGSAIAGSARLGDRIQMGGFAGVLGHLSICDDVVISSSTLVTKSITKAGFYTGVYPFEENAQWEKNAVSLKRLFSLREQVKAIDKHINLKTKEST